MNQAERAAITRTALFEERQVGQRTGALLRLAVGLMMAAAVLAAGRAAQAQQAQNERPEAQTITLGEATRIALEQNTTLKRAQSDARLRGTITTRERMDFLPNLQISSSGTRTFGRSFSQEEGAIINETSNFFGAEASANVDLFNGFEKFASLRRARLEETASTLRLERTRQDVVFQVFDGFTTLQQNRQLAEVRAQELEAQRELLEQVEALVEVGRRPVSDLYQQQAATAEARAALAAAQREVTLTETQLIQVLQLDPSGTYAFKAPALADSSALGSVQELGPVEEGAAYRLDRLLEQALARRADLGAADVSADAAEQGVRAARSGYWPSLAVGVGYGSDWSGNALLPVSGTGTDPRTITVTPDDGGPPATLTVPGTGTDPAFEQPAFLEQLDQRRGGSVRLSLSFPVFDRLETRTQVEEAQVQALNARYDLQDQQQQIALQVRQALADYRSAQTQLEATTERLEAARRAQEAARRRYELGAATFVEVTEALTEFVTARSARVRARYDVLLAQTLINYYTGGLDPQAPLFLPSSEGTP